LLILKLTLVPLALLAFGIAERLHGPRVAGWLAGFPIVAGPILVFLAMDHGADFTAAAALGAYFGLVPWLAFTACYAWCSNSWHWLLSALASLSAWAVAAGAVLWLQGGPHWLEILPFLLLVAAIVFYPRGKPSDEEREHVWWGLPARMLAGAGLTLLITQFAGMMGTRWSGVFTTFPVMGSIIAISTHVQYGHHAVRETVAGMATGLPSVAIFCFALYALLGRVEMWTAFGLALAASCAMHALTWLLFKKR
jgi:uncharacterized membrane protein (GlpM family)